MYVFFISHANKIRKRGQEQDIFIDVRDISREYECHLQNLFIGFDTPNSPLPYSRLRIMWQKVVSSKGRVLR